VGGSPGQAGSGCIKRVLLFVQEAGAGGSARWAHGKGEGPAFLLPPGKHRCYRIRWNGLSGNVSLCHIWPSQLTPVNRVSPHLA
jgi:hypothetical protein